MNWASNPMTPVRDFSTPIDSNFQNLDSRGRANQQNDAGRAGDCSRRKAVSSVR